MLDAVRVAQGLAPVRWAVPVAVLRCAARAGDVAGRWRGRRSPLDSASLAKLIGPAWFDGTRLGQDLGWRAGHTFAGSAGDLDPLSAPENEN
jgi:hypothetical protein